MNIRDVINEKLIELDIKANTKEEAIIELSTLLYKEGLIESNEEFVRSVLYREDVASTYCGFDLAIPHGISHVVKKPSICFGRTNGFNWTEDDDDFVKFIFLIAVPVPEEGNDEQSKHIDILSSIATLCLEEEVRQIWIKAKTPQEILGPLINAINAIG